MRYSTSFRMRLSALLCIFLSASLMLGAKSTAEKPAPLKDFTSVSGTQLYATSDTPQRRAMQASVRTAMELAKAEIARTQEAERAAAEAARIAEEARRAEEQRKAEQAKGRHLGTFRITHYCTGSCCNGQWAGVTATGASPNPGVTIAVDPRVIPLGSRVYIEGYGEFIAQDTGGAIKGNKIDVLVSSHGEAMRRGVTNRSVYIK